MPRRSAVGAEDVACPRGAGGAREVRPRGGGAGGPAGGGVGRPVCGERGFAVFGPGADGARMEGSKAFAKEIMQAAGVPTGRAATFTDYEQALAYLREHGRSGGDQGRRSGGRQGRHRRQDPGGGRGGSGRVLRRAALRRRGATPCSSRSFWRAKRSRCSPSSAAAKSCRLLPLRTTSGLWTATRVRTPGAWARTRRCPRWTTRSTSVWWTKRCGRRWPSSAGAASTSGACCTPG